MSTGPSHDNPPEALDSIRATLAEFRDECAEWQRDVDALFDDLSAATGALGVGADRTATEGQVLDELQTMGRTLCDENLTLREQQTQLVDEVATLRGLMEQQVGLFGSLLQAEDSRSERRYGIVET
ncbi:MAG: hypothetical protein ACC628_00100 [Pirellulaceae bacterium]